MTVASDALTRAEGLQLIGEMKGSGYRVPPALVRRGDGQTLQLTPLLYAVLDAVDGRRSPGEVAAAASAATGRTISAADVTTLVDSQLRPLGLLCKADGSQPELKRSDPLLGLRAKVSVTDPERTRRITDPFQVLFHPVVWVPVLAVFGWLTWWLLLTKGLASATYEAFQRPGLLLLVLLVTVLSAGFHEFGHAAAARRGGAQPGVMGAGIYLVWPAFYTDVTDSYRLGRVGRVRTDLGGLYFNAIVAVVIAGLWLATGYDALLLVVATQILQMIRQLTPLVRFDGYHVLADLTGVPDLFGRIGPVLASLWPSRRHDPRVTALKPWARAVVTVWVLAVVPLLLFSLVMLVVALPRLLGTAWASVVGEAQVLSSAWGSADVVGVAAAALSIVVFAFPVLAVAVLLTRFARSGVRAVLGRTEGRPLRRATAGLLVLALLGALAWAWWPDTGRYRPVLPFEGGTLAQGVAAPLARAGITLPGIAAADGPAGTRLSSGASGGRAQTVLPDGMDLPTEDAPMPALVLVPAGDGDGAVAGGEGADGGASGGGTDPAAPTWVFPFDRPLPPGDGDNQAMATNTTDGSVVYDVAMAMVWVDEDTVLNTNEAYAFASCSDCVTVAVAFQVVVVVGQSDVVVPQNLSGAVNYECFECITAAVASQLVVTVESMPGREEQVALAELWEEIAAFAATIPQTPLTEVVDRLEEFQEEIKDILGIEEEAATDAPAPAPTESVEPTATPTDDAGGTTGTDPDAADPSATATPADPATDDRSDSTDTGTDTGTEDGTDDGGESPTAEPTTSPSPAPSESLDPSAEAVPTDAATP